ncbi:MAG: transcription antiterminator [Erysipelotrichaceae bacterium]|nr:transcription antiterminator [Erysipelotrichaceae bacterium]
MKKNTYLNVIRMLLPTAEDSDTYITSEELAYKLNFSKRTILKCLNEIRTDVIANGSCELITKQGHGCRLEISDKEAFGKWYDSLSETEEGDSVETRRKTVLSRLLTANSYINIYDLADELYVSPSLIRKDIKALKELIEKYDLELKHSHSSGYMIAGDENNIRKAIAEECTTVLNQVLYEKAFHHNTETLSSLHECIADTLASYNITTTPLAINALAIHILIAINRIETENVINTGDISENAKKETEYQAAMVINDRIHKLFDVSLPEPELYYFSQHINGKQVTAIDFTQISDSDENEVIIFYNILLRSLIKDYNIDFFTDTNLRNNLLNHIGPFLHRLKNNMQIRKSNLSVIKDEFPFAYELAVSGLRKIQEKYPYDISEEETLYFALHLALSMETRSNKRKYNIAIVLDDSVTVFNMMSYKITTALERQVNMIQLFSYYNLDENEIRKFDIIINATDKKLWFDKPVVTTREFLSDADIEIIRLIMHKLDDQQDIDRFMSKDLFFKLEADNKDELLQKIISEINKHICLPENFYQLVMEREKFGSTSYGNKIAVPHPISSEGMPEFISICKLNKPIMWDDKYVQFVFLISLNTSGQSIQAFFSKLSKNLLDNEKIFQLQKVENYEEFLDVFFK